ncbi:hypothetical protein DVH24_025834 [Malus domestica]|uniref:Uncharacterized protein n=1 Tax=Malus domestica TaxID=3750 RepID=A0A498KGB1_MALDO|nr:hypothetical protein DVH24_025834 [Malus domestica]
MVFYKGYQSRGYQYWVLCGDLKVHRSEERKTWEQPLHKMGVRLADIHLSQTLRKAGALCTGYDLFGLCSFSLTYWAQ